jgi:CRISPR-associated protein (TIGR03986 family)
MITAPFNFVPLNKKVFFPSWAENISHDMPFIDGESGEIDIKIIAKSPIFIKNHAKDREKFCNHNGEYYIPSSSIKGVIRNVLEIMSFSKLNKSLFTDNTYAIRDLRNKELYMSKMTPEKTFCGWLKKENGKYFIENCGKPGRIKHEEIDKIFNIKFAQNFKKGKFGNKADDKTAIKKYDLINSTNFTHNFTYLKKDVNREIYTYNPNGEKEATLVLTGQPSARDESGKKPEGKIYEFLFFQPIETLEVEKKVFENFLFAYFDKRSTEPKESLDWTYWKKKFDNGEKIPVFFQKEENIVLHFGLSYLYKLPYNNSIKNGIPKVHFDEKLDLAESIFGYINKENKERALKGRVQFSHFKATENIKFLKEVKETLGTPRASYYPLYVNQEKKVYSTFMDNNFEIIGRKRYPLHKQNSVSKTKDTGNENIKTTFIPMKEGVVFEGKLRYHNLKKVELGALLSAITFHNTPNTYHNIGMAKSLGYGKIEIKLNGIEIEEYLKEFEYIISTQIDNWIDSEELKELLSMATEQNNSGNSVLEYMKLDDFAKNKVDKNYLKYYIKLDNIKTVSPKTLLSEDDLKKIESKRQEYIKLQEKIKIEKKQKKDYEEMFEFVKNSENIAQIESFISKYPDSKDLEFLKNRINNLNEKAKLEEQEKINKETGDKYQDILKLTNIKHQESGLEKFIEDYPNFKFIEEAKEKLKELKSRDEKVEIDFIEEIKKANSGKRVNQLLSKELIETQKDELKEAIKECFNNLNSKNRKKFFKEARIGGFDKNFEEELKNILS